MRRDRKLVAETRRIGMARRAARPVAGRWTRTVQAFLARTTVTEPARPGGAEPPRRAE